MSVRFQAQLQTALHERQQNKLYRKRLCSDSACGSTINIGDQNLLQFCSNDYLGLANHPKVKHAFVNAAYRFGVGSGASHLVSGHTALHHELEQALAAFTGRDRALLFSTGFMANIGTVQALAGKGDAIFEDKLNHASLIDGGLHSEASFSRFLHNDMASLAQKLIRSDANRKLIVADAVFSMDGDIAPVDELIVQSQQHDAVLMLDDAHGFGVLNKGRGLSVYSQQEVPVYMATLGKSAGVFGAFVAGSEALIEYLIQFARPYIYTTALPPAVAAANLAALDVMQTETWRYDHLQALITQFRQGAAAQGFEVMPSTTAIQPILLGDAAKALAYTAALRRRSILIAAIRPPTVPPATSRLRITLSASHTEAHIEQLISALVEVRQECDDE